MFWSYNLGCPSPVAIDLLAKTSLHPFIFFPHHSTTHHFKSCKICTHHTASYHRSQVRLLCFPSRHSQHLFTGGLIRLIHKMLISSKPPFSTYPSNQSIIHTNKQATNQENIHTHIHIHKHSLHPQTSVVGYLFSFFLSLTLLWAQEFISLFLVSPSNSESISGQPKNGTACVFVFVLCIYHHTPTFSGLVLSLFFSFSFINTTILDGNCMLSRPVGRKPCSLFFFAYCREVIVCFASCSPRKLEDQS